MALLLMFAIPVLSNAYAIVDNAEQLPKKKLTLNVALLYSARGHRGFFRHFKKEFEAKHPDITLVFTGLLDAEYKQAVMPWLMSGQIDVLYWQAGERLNAVAKNNLILPIDELWQKEQFDTIFPKNIKQAVSHNDKIYALPYAYYTWGLFYNKALLSDLGLEPPIDWPALLSFCQAVRQEGLVPIMIGSQDPWLPAAWFDYIDLRLNGLAFHQELLAGKVSFTDERVKNVFVHWKAMIENDCFISTHEHLSWRNLLPPLFRKMAAMTLLGNFLDNNTPPEFQDDIGYQAFPMINKEIARYEDVPLDVFVISQRSKNIPAAKKFLKFMSRADIQSTIANTIGQSSPHLKATNSNYFSKKNKSILLGAEGLAQYFDRDINQHMVTESLAIFKTFLTNPNIERTTSQLEKLRLRTAH